MPDQLFQGKLMFSTALSAPHRALFATGTVAVIAAMLWWGAVLLGRALGQDWADASLPAIKAIQEAAPRIAELYEAREFAKAMREIMAR